MHIRALSERRLELNHKVERVVGAGILVDRFDLIEGERLLDFVLVPVVQLPFHKVELQAC